MSEYIDIDAELGDDGHLLFHTNLKLTASGSEEYYPSAAAMAEGSPIAQALSVIEAVETLGMSGGELLLTTRPDADWHAIIADVTAALKDFFL